MTNVALPRPRPPQLLGELGTAKQDEDDHTRVGTPKFGSASGSETYIMQSVVSSGSPGAGEASFHPEFHGSRSIATIRGDCVAGPSIADPGQVVASRTMRFLIFLSMCQLVQAFMSYDGGATPASLDTIQAEMDNSWTPSEFGLLGSMDKIGMTATSILWGRALQLCDPKLLLVLGLALNTVCTALFGSLRDKGLMMTMKFLLGASQSLQGVWSTVWTVTMAPPEYKTVWLGMGGLSAGVGNGIGTAVAGFSTGNGLPYALAFQVQAAVLGLLWVVLMVLRRRWLVLTLPRGIDSPSTSGSEVSGLSTLSQLRLLSKNKVYMWTALAISSAMFQMSGIQFLWVRAFVEVWGLNKNHVTVAFLVVTALGGGLGLGIGPRYIDKGGGFGTPHGVAKTLKILSTVSVIAATAGTWGILCLIGKLRSKDQGYWRTWGDHWLWMIWIAILLIWAARNACIPALCGINVEVVPVESRSFASGMEMTLRNILGYAFGPLLPGLIMDLVGAVLQWDAETENDWQLCVGLAFVLAGNFVDFFLFRRSLAAAKIVLEVEQTAALAQLREAFQTEDIAALENAVLVAKSVGLQTRKDGESVIGMANETIGAHNAHLISTTGQSPTKTKSLFRQSKIATATHEELVRRVSELDLEAAQLRAENERLRLLVDSNISANIIGCSSANRHSDTRVKL